MSYVWVVDINPACAWMLSILPGEILRYTDHILGNAIENLVQRYMHGM